MLKYVEITSGKPKFYWISLQLVRIVRGADIEEPKFGSAGNANDITARAVSRYLQFLTRGHMCGVKPGSMTFCIPFSPFMFIPEDQYIRTPKAAMQHLLGIASLSLSLEQLVVMVQMKTPSDLTTSLLPWVDVRIQT